MKFRADINGIRAIAVTGVVLFHFFPQFIPGGFTGVDVFFVISGFLMTEIIVNKVENNNFSLVSFYKARANRILPELLCMLCVILILGFFLATPLAYKALAKHALGSYIFISNLMYTLESGYFDVASHEKWFLHTWSLSVEWQFYIIYPLIIISLAKIYSFSIKTISLVILFLTILSYLFSVCTTSIWPSAAYFCLPSRLWELTLGGLAYLYPWKQNKEQSYLEILGFLLIIGSFFCLMEQSTYPGYLAALPTLGTFFIIQSSREKSVLTSNVICQKIGELSYSIYLWHWPLVVIIYSFALPNYCKIAFIGLSLVLGYLSNHYIGKKNPSGILIRYRQPLFTSLFVVLGVFSLIASNTNAVAKLKLDNPSFAVYQDLINTKKETIEKYTLNHTDFRKEYVKHSTCSFDKQMPSEHAFQCAMNIIKDKGWLVIGDSHGRDFYHALEIAYPDKNIAMIQQSSCAPATALKQNSRIICFQEMDKVIDFINNNPHIERVVFAARYTDESGTPAFLKQLNSDVYKRDLIVVNSGLHLDRDVSNYLSRYGVREYYPMEKKFTVLKHKVNWDIGHIQRKNIKTFDKYHAFCNKKDQCKLLDKSNVLYIDNQHLSEKGMIYLAQQIKQSNIME